MKTKSQFRGFTPWHITQIPNSIFTPYMEIGSSPTSGSNLRLVSVLKKTPSHQQDPNQCLTYVCLIDYSWTAWPAGWQAHQLAYCLPEKTERVEGVEKPWLYPILHPSSDEPPSLAQEACPQAQTSLIPLSRTGLPHLTLTCLQDPCIWCHKDPGSISASSDTPSHSGTQAVHIQSTAQGGRKDRLQVCLFLKGKNKGGRSWHWVKITILQKEPGEERKPNLSSWPQRNEGSH